jgi:hypothetical protein
MEHALCREAATRERWKRDTDETAGAGLMENVLFLKKQAREYTTLLKRRRAEIMNNSWFFSHHLHKTKAKIK